MALLRGTDLAGLPVVTLSGDDVGEVRDVLFDAQRGTLIGFTLNKRGRLRGRMSEVLAQANVAAAGPDAVMIADLSALTLGPLDNGEIADSGEPVAGRSPLGDVISDSVLTDSGVLIGTVSDVVIDTRLGSVVGFEINPADEQRTRHGRKAYMPFHDTHSISGEHLIVPAAAIEYITTDFAGFAEAVDRYRDLLTSPVATS
jgi:uncharacterized protein YrrD